jgi:hypothetical protein
VNPYDHANFSPTRRCPGWLRLLHGLSLGDARFDIKAGHRLIEFVLNKLVKFAIVGFERGKVADAELRGRATGVVGFVASVGLVASANQSAPE